MSHQGRWARWTVALALVAGGALAAGTAGGATPKPTPTGAGQAQAQARNAARHVASVRSELKKATTSVERANRTAAAAQARYEQQRLRQRAAKQALQLATARARVTEQAYQQRHADYVRLIVSQYEGGDDATGVGALLTADDPAKILDAAQIQQLLAEQESAIVERDAAAAAANNAAQAQRAAALDAERTTTRTLAAIRNRAARALERARTDVQSLRKQLQKAQVSQAQAEAVLSMFLGGWSIADPARADALNRQYLANAQAQAHAQPALRSRHWTAAMATTVVIRALLRIGTPYAWDGGTAAGPSRGVCAGGGAENDCHLVGFDCSGLALYAWAPYLAMPHSAAAQYTAAGREHPRPAQLRPGDLVFWSDNGAVSGIHHVAIYVGDGNVVQAPQSGDIVRVTPLRSVDSGYFGATRPLS